MNLDGKKILFLSANFFGYEKAIQKKLEKLGSDVDFFNERPSNSLLSKGIIRVKSTLLQRRIDSYYSKILQEIAVRKYDYFLLIKGETIPLFFLEKFKELNPNAITIFYAYDAAAEYPKFLKLYPYFDRNFTFEPADALQYNLHFRPLFFLENYGVKDDQKTEYDLVFIGSAHTDRYIIGEEIRVKAEQLKLKPYFYYYAPGKTIFALKKIFDKNLKKFDAKKLSFKKLQHSEIAAVYAKSFAVLDLNKPFQKGLTMRTFEALAAGKKLITTNEDIKNYPFYSAENIAILDRNHLILSLDFFQSGFKNMEESDLDKMTLQSWIECLFFKDQDDYWKNNKG